MEGEQNGKTRARYAFALGLLDTAWCHRARFF
jgi:hypothetical protein